MLQRVQIIRRSEIITEMRIENWPQRLNDFIESRRNSKFEWGSNDCCMFAALAIEAVLGFNEHAKYLGSYSTRQGARNVLCALTRQQTYSRAVAALPDVLGYERCNPKLAQRGDLVLIRQHRVPALGVVSMDGRFAVAPGHTGIMKIPINQVIAAWRID